ncbi:NAC domain containing protein 41 [Euphorbia peplus]|nr:NAC domain containing protein 41 [Euphorbia peplus]
MEKYQGTLVNGGMRLPIGYRFHPTDEELIVHYLRRKIFGLPLPASIIPELDVFQHDPWTLPGDLKEKRYFFGRKFGNEKRFGAKKTFIFCHSDASKIQWILQEYHFLGAATIPHNIKASKSKLGEWVVYRLSQRRKRPKQQQRIHSKSSNTSEVFHSNFME